MSTSSTPFIPSLEDIRSAHARLREHVFTTPAWGWRTETKSALLGDQTQAWFKLELMQKGNSFKTRGALAVMMGLSREALARGVTAVSAGNHAIAVSLVANMLGTHNKVVMPPTASPAGIERCQRLGAEVIVVDDIADAFTTIERIQAEEGRAFVHPFEGPYTALGTATVAYEYLLQVPELEAAIIPIGGGGLAAGMSLAFKRLKPEMKVYGVEATGAPNMYNSFKQGSPAKNKTVDTIAASLSPPFSMPYTYQLCREHLEEVVLVSDDELCQGMAVMFQDLKLVAEPAGAASLAALLGPLKHTLAGKKVGLIACGSNIDLSSFHKYVQRGLHLLAR